MFNKSKSFFKENLAMGDVVKSINKTKNFEHSLFAFTSAALTIALSQTQYTPSTCIVSGLFGMQIIAGMVVTFQDARVNYRMDKLTVLQDLSLYGLNAENGEGGIARSIDSSTLSDDDIFYYKELEDEYSIEDIYGALQDEYPTGVEIIYLKRYKGKKVIVLLTQEVNKQLEEDTFLKITAKQLKNAYADLDNNGVCDIAENNYRTIRARFFNICKVCDCIIKHGGIITKANLRDNSIVYDTGEGKRTLYAKELEFMGCYTLPYVNSKGKLASELVSFGI